MAEIVFKGHACIDCTMAIANGDFSSMTDYDVARWNERVAAIALYELGTVVMACDEDCEGYFSWSSCDYCGSSLGGDRHPIAVLA